MHAGLVLLGLVLMVERGVTGLVFADGVVEMVGL